MATGLSEPLFFGANPSQVKYGPETGLRTLPEEEDLAAFEWTRIEQAGLDRVTFAWAGPTERGFGKGHYYKVKGPTFMLEYDITQNDANHIHSVWRDFTNGWAEDLLASHLNGYHR